MRAQKKERKEDGMKEGAQGCKGCFVIVLVSVHFAQPSITGKKGRKLEAFVRFARNGARRERGKWRLFRGSQKAVSCVAMGTAAEKET